MILPLFNPKFYKLNKSSPTNIQKNGGVSKIQFTFNRDGNKSVTRVPKRLYELRLKKQHKNKTLHCHHIANESNAW